MKLRALLDFGNIEDFENLKRFVTSFSNEVANILNGSVEFGINIKSNIVSDISFNGSNSVTIQHGLGRTPVGYILVKSSANIALSILGEANADTIILTGTGSPSSCSVMFF